MKCDNCGHQHYEHSASACLDDCECSSKNFHHIELVDDKIS